MLLLLLLLLLLLPLLLPPPPLLRSGFVVVEAGALACSLRATLVAVAAGADSAAEVE